jgi:N-acetyl-gamma-glutamyl-phosphate reductase
MKDKVINIGIIGGAGYTGGELIRILLGHPDARIQFVHSRSHSGNPVHEVHTDLYGDTDLLFSGGLIPGMDVLFLCVGPTEAIEFLSHHVIDARTKIIDLSQDFRLSEKINIDGGRKFVYGLPEFNLAAIREADNIANPGCFATAIQLALLPLARAKQLNEVHVTGITGATGAGQKLQSSSHFAWRANNIQAYKTLCHQHINEIRQTLTTCQSLLPDVNFIPWRGDFARGIYVSAYTRSDLSLEEANTLYRAYYQHAVFTRVSSRPVDLKQVVNTNKCFIYLEKAAGKLIIHAAIDNLLKGASGQAVQNMNIMFGLPQQTGLALKSTAF